jgi:YesN/AraC family two-component response regulator
MAKILIIDDDNQFRKMLCQTIEKAGHTVSEAVNGTKGVESFQQTPVDLVITDIVMPDKEGIETIMEIRRMAPSIKIIAVSGGGRIGSDSYLDLARKLGAVETFSKPIDRKKLVETIDKVLS